MKAGPEWEAREGGAGPGETLMEGSDVASRQEKGNISPFTGPIQGGR